MKNRVSFFIKKYKNFFIKYVNKNFFSVMSLQRVTTVILLCKVKREKIMKKLENNIQDKDLLNQHYRIADGKRKVTLNLDKVENYSKPNDSIKTIQWKLGTAKTTVTVEELAYWLHNGATMKAAALNGAKNVDWESQEVFALDFDNGPKDVEKFGIITIDYILERCEAYNIRPAFYYTSFSHQTEKDNFVDKFRLVFISDIKVTDIRVRNVIQMALMNIFPECDKACKDLSRVFYGSKQGAVALDYDATINTLDVVQAMVSYIQANNTSSTSAKMLKAYCQTVGLNMVNGLPDVKEYDDENGPNECNLINNIITLHANGPKISLNFNIAEGAYKIQVDSTDGKAKGPKVAVDATKTKRRLIERFDFDKLEEKCLLYNGFVNQSYWPNHTEVMHIAQNLCSIKGGQKRYDEAIDKFGYTQSEAWNKKNSFSYYAKMEYAPSRCTNDTCPFRGECANTGRNMHHAVDMKKNNIRRIEEEKGRMEIEEGYENTQMAIREGFNETRKGKMNIVISPTGIGKSTMLQTLATEDPESFNNTIVAFPNHKLLNEQVEKLSTYLPNLLYVHEVEFDEKNERDMQVKAKFNGFQAIGNYKEARKTLEEYVQELISTANSSSDIEVKKALNNKVININDYLDLSKEVQQTNRPIFCTHKRLTLIKNPKVERIIIDEDIVNTTVQMFTLTATEVATARNRAEEYNLKNLYAQLDGLYNFLKRVETTAATVVPYDLGLANVNAKELKTLLSYYTPSFNVADALTIKAGIKSVDGVITVYKTHELPHLPITVLSATANETVYRALFKDFDIEVTRVEDVEHNGEVIVHYGGMSRNYLNQSFDKAVARIREEAPGVTNMVTFKSFSSKFNKEGFNVICNYGASTGIDAYGGQDLVVVGTPHVNAVVYMIYAHVCGIDKAIVMDLEFVNVRRNGFEFTFSTFNSNDLSKTGELIREIQFYLIESELIQAVGRARVLRNNCTVHLFSNLPLKGAKIYGK